MVDMCSTAVACLQMTATALSAFSCTVDVAQTVGSRVLGFLIAYLSFCCLSASSRFLRAAALAACFSVPSMMFSVTKSRPAEVDGLQSACHMSTWTSRVQSATWARQRQVCSATHLTLSYPARRCSPSNNRWPTPTDNYC